jgi:hypothetical protein
MALYQPGVARATPLDKQLKERDISIHEIRDRLLTAQAHMKQYYDQGHRNVALDVGDWAWLHLYQRSTTGITDKSTGKLAPRYFGPYLVLERIGEVAYCLQLPPRAKIHDVFHVVFLKKHHGDPLAAVVPLPQVVQGRVVPTPASIKRA